MLQLHPGGSLKPALLKQAVNTCDVIPYLSSDRGIWTYWTTESTATTSKDIKTKRAQLGDIKLRRLWESDAEFVGLPFGKTTWYFILDIDKTSPYNNPVEVMKIKRLFEQRRITLHICGSSSSGGLHLLGIFDRPVKSSRIAKLAVGILRKNNFNIMGGILEVYPSQKRQPLRLPFQRGFRLLDDDLDPIWEGPTADTRASKFLWLAENQASQVKEINWKVPQLPPLNPAKMDVDRYNTGEALYHYGLNESTSRHEALKAVQYYLFFNGYPYGKEKERRQLMIDWISSKHNGFSKDWLRNPREVIAEIDRLVNWRPLESACRIKTNRYADYNTARSGYVRASIIDAVERLKQTGMLYKKNGSINRAAVVRLAKINPRSAAKYQPLIESTARKLILLNPLDSPAIPV